MYDEIISQRAEQQTRTVLARLGRNRTSDQRHAFVNRTVTIFDQQAAEQRIQALESRLQQLNNQVREDQLTGSLNRRGLDEVLARELERARRQRAPLCVAMLDLDNFKQLNDRYGHCIGDDVLVHLVSVLKQSLRSIDIVARFGGEEFLIVLPDTSLAAASLVLNRLQQTLVAQVWHRQQRQLTVTLSIGLASHDASEDQRNLISRADAALYQAKQGGKNRIVNAR
jgi:diguanylate cyclase